MIKPRCHLHALVLQGRKPDALYKVKDPEVRQFVEKCLATVSLRLSALELLNDPFLQLDDCEYDLRPVDYGRELDDTRPLIRQPLLEFHDSNSGFSNGYSNGYGFEAQNEWSYHSVEIESNGIELFEHHDDDHTEDVDISIKGKKSKDGGIFLRLRISDKEGWNLFYLLSVGILLVGCLLFLFSGNQMWHCGCIFLQAVSGTFISHSMLRQILH